MRTTRGPSADGQEEFPQSTNQVILYVIWVIEDPMESWTSEH